MRTKDLREQKRLNFSRQIILEKGQQRRVVAGAKWLTLKNPFVDFVSALPFVFNTQMLPPYSLFCSSSTFSGIGRKKIRGE
ncbi:hypothetical protein VNO77_15947 [Canavalia gladiata]|uniref:Uncharacterized protein n=1 Tax=Canavalia gladiata TaxID=3824 RepID=A0AAN9LZK0_CANGL